MSTKKKVAERKPYKSYPFRLQDPAVKEVLEHVAASGVKGVALSRSSGVSVSTIMNWRKRKTMRPQNASIEATGRAVGMKRVWVSNRSNSRSA